MSTLEETKSNSSEQVKSEQEPTTSIEVKDAPAEMTKDTPKETTTTVEMPEETTTTVEMPKETTTAVEMPEETTTTVEMPEETTTAVEIPEKVRILKEAFPDTDIDIIEAILQATQDNVESAFEALLGMSDPNFQPEEQAPPPMPPRPTQQREPSVEEQLRLDEEFAKKLAMEDEIRVERRRQHQRNNQTNSDEEDDPFMKFQEELPIIKEKMKEAGNAAKKKVLDLYNQFKANTQKNTTQNAYDHMSTMPTTTHAQYRGLPGDDGDDLLTGDNTALHLSDYDVYAKTNGRQRLSNEYTIDNDTIHVNPPLNTPISKVQTSTSDAQLKADEDFARRLAEEDQIDARRSREEETIRNTPPQMPPRKNVIISPRSPLEMAGDSDYEDIGLTASSKNNDTTQSNAVPYVIGDDDDSDSDLDLQDLVDEEENKAQVPKKESTKEDVKEEQVEKPNTH